MSRGLKLGVRGGKRSVVGRKGSMRLLGIGGGRLDGVEVVRLDVSMDKEKFDDSSIISII